MTVGIDELSALALTNYGHFTSMRVENLRVRGLALHMERLAGDSRRLFDTELDTERVRALIRHALRDRPDAAQVRVTVFDPKLDFGCPGGTANPRVLVSVRPTGPQANPPARLRLQSVKFCRELPEVKHVGLFSSLHHRRTAQRNGFDDVLFVTPDGRVSEIATSNVGIVSDGRVMWPDAPCLPGVTMRLLSQVRGENRRAAITIADLAAAEAVFATNAAVGIRPVVGIDDLPPLSGVHPVFQEIRAQYAAVTTESL